MPLPRRPLLLLLPWLPGCLYSMTVQLKDAREVRALAAPSRLSVPVLQPQEVGEKLTWDAAPGGWACRSSASFVRDEGGELAVHHPGCRASRVTVVAFLPPQATQVFP